jgi:mannose-6-phosphate isomerase-like protein (cupin superfamily)
MDGLVEEASLARSRLIRREELVASEEAFIDCRLPGSMPKLNYSIIGPGVTQSEKQVVNLSEEHGFAIGAAAMPNGVTNNLHIHFTAEVFMIFRGEWLFRWGPNGEVGEFVGRAGDILSMPTWMFRGFTNVGPDDGWIFTALGRDDTGGVIWHPEILRRAAETGLWLRKDNMLVDVAAGAAAPPEDDLLQPLSDQFIATLHHPSPEEMRARITTASERRWSERALLQAVLPGHDAALAPVIGWGMTEDRYARPKVADPHGFSVEWLRIGAGSRLGPFRIAPKQVLIVQEGELEIELGDGSSVIARPWDVFSVPAGEWRTLRSVSEEPAVMTVTTAGDGRARIEWPESVHSSARDEGFGIDPNGYIAPVHCLPATLAAG